MKHTNHINKEIFTTHVYMHKQKQFINNNKHKVRFIKLYHKKKIIKKALNSRKLKFYFIKRFLILSSDVFESTDK